MPLIPEPHRYFDTAALAYGCAFPNAEHPKQLVEPSQETVPKGYDLFYGPNATQCLVNFLNCLGNLISCNVTPIGSLHPVIDQQVSEFNSPENDEHDFRIGIYTRFNWLDGAGLTNRVDAQRFDLVVEDVVQGVATTRMESFLRKLDSDKFVVYLGCLQKWAGSSYPVGFLLIPHCIFEEFPSLASRLCALDYLGNSVPRGQYLTDFRDTYSSKVGQQIGHSFNLAFGFESEISQRHYKLITENSKVTFHLLRNFFENADVFCLEPSSGIITVRSETNYLKRKYNELNVRASVFVDGVSACARFSVPLVRTKNLILAFET